jgi:hypothetical protein
VRAMVHPLFRVANRFRGENTSAGISLWPGGYLDYIAHIWITSAGEVGLLLEPAFADAE